MRTFAHDFRYGLRLMAGSPGVFVVAALALALGIGANTAVFSVVHNVLLAKLPVSDPDRLVGLAHRSDTRNITSPMTPYPDVVEWRRTLRSLESITAAQHASVNLGGDEPERVGVAKVNANFFPTLGVRPVYGRDFAAGEDRPGGPKVAILSYALWNKRYGSNTGEIGGIIRLDGEPYTIIGVLPEGFRFTGSSTDVYVPLNLPEVRGARIPMAVRAFARLKAGVTPEQLKPELDAATAETRSRVPAYRSWRLTTTGLSDWVSPFVRTSLWVLLGAAGLVVLIACVNVANLLLARGAARSREMAVRASLGASRSRLIRQALAESTPLGMIAGAAGLALAWAGVQLLSQFELNNVPRLNETAVNGTVLAFTAALSILTCLVFGLAPSFAAARTEVHEALKEGGRSAAGSLRGSRLRAVLVVTEIALALVLSTGATLLLRTFQTLAKVDPGFSTDNLLTANVDFPRSKFKNRAEVIAHWDRITTRLKEMPGVQAVALTNSLPLGGNYMRGDFKVEGREYPQGHGSVLNVRWVDTGYFSALRIPLRRGRLFTGDDRESSLPVALINEACARLLFGSEDPIGRRIGDDGEWRTIVGIIGNIRHTDVGIAPDNEILLPFTQAPFAAGTLAVRLDQKLYPDPARFSPALRRAIAEVDPNQAAYRVLSLQQIMANRLMPQKVNMLLVAMFAGLALLLAAIGIYGLLSFTVERRQHEIGIRMALGAEAGDVARLIVRQAMALAAIGAAIGIGASLAFGRVLRSMLYGVSATNPWIIAGAAAGLAVIAAASAYMPARRAASIDPVEALRCE